MIQGAQLSNSFILLMVLNASGVRSINQVFPLERAAEAFVILMKVLMMSVGIWKWSPLKQEAENKELVIDTYDNVVSHSKSSLNDKTALASKQPCGHRENGCILNLIIIRNIK
jgi:hypothetical protein